MKENSFKKYTYSLILFGVLFVATFYFLLRGGELHKVIRAVMHANFKWLALGIAFVFTYMLCDAKNIQILLRHQGTKISLWRALSYTLVGFYFSAVTPSSTGGQPMQIYYMAREKIGVGQSTLTLMFAQIMYHFSRLALGLFLLLFNFPVIANVVKSLKWVFVYGFCVSLIIMIGLSCLLFTQNVVRRAGTWFLRIGVKLKIIKDYAAGEVKLEKMLEDYQKGSKLITHSPALVFRVFFVALVQITAMLSIPFAVSRAFGLHNVPFSDMLAIQVILTLSVDTLPLPGAVGAAESAFLMVYRRLFGMRLVVPAMLLSRGLSFYSCMLIGGIVVMLVHFRSMEVKHESPLQLKSEMTRKR